jgi:hypothetical protein
MNKIKLKDAFNCDKVFPKPFFECQKIAKSKGYKYMLFNTLLYSVDAKNGECWLCKKEDLIV